MPDRDYLSAVDVSKLVRKALKVAFPGVPFSVRSRGSIDVSYVDGPPIEAVKRVVDRYAGSYFDGMIDYQGSIYHELDGKPVRLLATFVFARRDLSGDAMLEAIKRARAAGAYGADDLQVEPFINYKGKPDARLHVEAGHGHQVSTPNHQGFKHPVAALADWFDLDRPAAELEPASMAEADRLKIVGDDGYGAGRGYGGYPQQANAA